MGITVLGLALRQCARFGFVFGALSSASLSACVVWFIYELGVLAALAICKIQQSLPMASTPSKQGGVITAVTAACCAVGIALRIFPDVVSETASLVALYALDFLVSGFMTLAAQVAYDRQATCDENAIRLLAFIPPIGGALIALASYWAIDPIGPVLFSAMPIAAVPLCCFAETGDTADHGRPQQESRARQHSSDRAILSQKVHVHLFFLGMLLGFCAMHLPQPASIPAALAICLSVLVMHFLLAQSAVYIKLLSPGMLHGLLVPIGVTLMFSMAIGAHELVVLAAVIAIVCLFVQESSNLYCLIEDSELFDIRKSPHIGEGRIPPVAGIVCGMGAAVAIFLIPTEYGQLVTQATSAALAVLVAGSSFLIHGKSEIVINSGVVDYGSAKTGESGISAVAMRDRRIPLDDGERNDVREQDADDAFREHCDRIAIEAGLTSRERDVLYLLGRGYNANSIGEVLFISANTAKTHSSRIYRKMGVKTHQELIKLLHGQ